MKAKKKFFSNNLSNYQEWIALKENVRERDNCSCQFCGESAYGQVHHIIPRRNGGLCTLDNLVLLCGFCHMCESKVPLFAVKKAFPKHSMEKIKNVRKTIRNLSDLSSFKNINHH